MLNFGKEKLDIINVVEITKEAAYDYEDCLGYGKLNKRVVKSDVELYFNNKNRTSKFICEKYIRVKYLDENTGNMLMLFFYKKYKISILQYWSLVGICLNSDWSEDLEISGAIRRWLKPLELELENVDWVKDQIARAEADSEYGYYKKGRIIGLPKEFIDGITHGDNKTFAERVSHFKNPDGKPSKRRRIDRKDYFSRKINTSSSRKVSQFDKNALSRKVISRRSSEDT